MGVQGPMMVFPLTSILLIQTEGRSIMDFLDSAVTTVSPFLASVFVVVVAVLVFRIYRSAYRAGRAQRWHIRTAPREVDQEKSGVEVDQEKSGVERVIKYLANNTSTRHRVVHR